MGSKNGHTSLPERACSSPGPWSSAEASPHMGALQLSIPLPPFNTGLQRAEQPSAALSCLASCRDRVRERYLSTSDLLVTHLAPYPAVQGLPRGGGSHKPTLRKNRSKVAKSCFQRLSFPPAHQPLSCWRATCHRLYSERDSKPCNEGGFLW